MTQCIIRQKFPLYVWSYQAQFCLSRTDPMHRLMTCSRTYAEKLLEITGNWMQIRNMQIAKGEKEAESRACSNKYSVSSFTFICIINPLRQKQAMQIRSLEIEFLINMVALPCQRLKAHVLKLRPISVLALASLSCLNFIHSKLWLYFFCESFHSDSAYC